MSSKTKPAISWLRAGYLALAAIAMYILISELSSFRGSLNDLKTADLRYVILVMAGTGASFLFAALTYYFLALKPLKYGRTIVVQIGINTLNRLLPAGIGGIGGNYVYLTKSRHSKSQAGAVVAVNTVIGVIANLMLLVVLLFYFPINGFKFSSVNGHLVIAGCTIVILLAAVLALMPRWRKLIAHRLKLIAKNVYSYQHHKVKLAWGLLCQVGLTLAFVLALYFSLKAVGGSLPIGSVMLAYSFAIWLGAIIPAPGGAGSVDAGLVAGLVAFNVNLPEAVATVVIFRLVSFWLPFILGFGPLFWAYSKDYL